MQTKKDLISIKDLALEEIEHIFELADTLKTNLLGMSTVLTGRSMGMIFQKSSNRTRVSFEVGMAQLGGHAIYLGPDTIKLGVREKTSDIAKTLSRYLDVIVARVNSHKDILELAQCATIPVINGLSDLSHPCQGLADAYTVKEQAGIFKNKKLAFVGDGNNVLNSLLYISAKLGLNISVATPRGYQPNKDVFSQAQAFATKSGAKITLGNEPKEAVRSADFIYTDVWASMGQEKEAVKRKRAFKGFTIDRKLVLLAKKDCKIMHCLPAHRGEEITDEVIDSVNSIVFDQAENRLHVQKAILVWLLTGK
jgi:ornithine carbamoyltransferase